jgi:hypothetical protein
MSAQTLARLAAVGPVAMTLVPRRFNTLYLFPVALLLASCAAQPPLPAGPDPSDPGVRTPHAAYRSAIGSYTRQRPVTPSDWQEQNEQVAPAPKSSE